MPNANVTAPTTAANKWSGNTNEAPRSALQFRSACKFEAAEAGATVPFTMTARSSEPVDHWYWGRCVHDMAGMQLTKKVLPVDWCHDSYEAMGFADKFDGSGGDLIVAGKLTPMADRENDRATEVIHKQKLGVPYEASIDFSNGALVIEYVASGASVQVNGKTFEGPGVVFRQWELRSVAICLYGVDGNTSTEFSAGDKDNIKFSLKGSSMPESKATDTKTPATPAPAEAAQLSQPATPATPAAAPAAEVKPHEKFTKAFGAQGAAWYLEGKSFDDCATEFTSQLKTAHAAELQAIQTKFASEKQDLVVKLDAANAKLAAIPRGDNGATFSNADGGNVDSKAAKLAQNLGEGTGRFAAGMKLPGQSKK